MKKGSRDHLKLGEWNALCQVCGFKFKASELRLRWDGIRACSADYEERHPQDLIRVPRDNPSIPWSSPNDYVIRDMAPVDGSDL